MRDFEISLDSYLSTNLKIPKSLNSYILPLTSKLAVSRVETLYERDRPITVGSPFLNIKKVGIPFESGGPPFYYKHFIKSSLEQPIPCYPYFGIGHAYLIVGI